MDFTVSQSNHSLITVYKRHKMLALSENALNAKASQLNLTSGLGLFSFDYNDLTQVDNQICNCFLINTNTLKDIQTTKR